MLRRWLEALALALGLGGSAQAVSFGIAFYIGLSATAPTDLRVMQAGQADALVQGARFATEPFSSPPYYGVRAWVGESLGWRFELELTHQKLYYAGAASGGEAIDWLTVTDGHNVLTANVSYYWPLASGLQVGVRGGAGVAIPHPESSVRGQALGVHGDPNGYHLGGFSARAGLAIEGVLPGTPLYGTLEVQGTFTSGWLLIAGGRIEGDFLTGHLIVGPGLRLP